jgi:type 1 glutamine amidotransferase
MKEGGGLVVVHAAAADSWGDWVEFNKMIGLGGWGGRNEKSGLKGKGPLAEWPDLLDAWLAERWK